MLAIWQLHRIIYRLYLNQEHIMKNNTTIHFKLLVASIILASISGVPSETADMSASENFADATHVSSQTQKILSESKIKLLK
jgi:hypothetical protein